MKLKVVDIKGKDTGRKVSLPTKIFDIEPNNQAIYLDIKAQMANKRQGTHKAKERSEIVGSNRKIKKQKGTGSARAGSIKNPIFRGGGRVFGPRVRDYSQKINKKLKCIARKSALSIKARSNSIFVVEEFYFDRPSTKGLDQFLKLLKTDTKNSLLIFAEENKNVYLSTRNLKKAESVITCELNTYLISKAQNLVFFENSISELEKLLN
ncbi:MAG: 50S ribosomal protein L4 [Flavobacteriaceae bacterium TMED200]|nr:MAG: 50S ribosomal protein L4 [Flavobacteriaceae bacterium TMED200]|tara:strand:- start:3001 stop:3627 length:627 start_codon:yes stop_codon:yes gene_type:complete